jgi:hypothetical protein
MAFHYGGGWNRNRKRQTPGLFDPAVPWALRGRAAGFREICQRNDTLAPILCTVLVI